MNTGIATIAIVVATFLWFKFSRRKNHEIPSDSGTTDTHSESNSLFEPSSSDETASIYEVFLSFCGKDTRKGFTDFLYTYLISASIQTFRDDNELRVGEEINSELLKAIKTSKISIPIFSQRYASSKWCLLELAEMVDCNKNGNHMIFPIFYDVDPWEVRNQKGCYEKAFREHEKKFDVEMVRRWREALRMVGEMKGLELKKETNGNEGELVKKIVEKVLQQLRKNHTHVPETLVGIDKHVERLKELLEIEAIGVRIVGIHGMGGIGKTTISKVTYNQLIDCFESHCFLENVRESSEPRDGTVTLQKQLISKLRNMESPRFSDINEGSKIIKDTVCGKKVLIVLDDVDEISQVHMLIGDHKWFSAESRIIITTRDKAVLDQIEISCEREGLLDVCRSYEAKFMDESNSLELFSKYAFKTNFPLEGYEDYSKEVLKIAAGLPLVLVVLGSMLYYLKGVDLWEAKLEKLRAIQPREILEKLKISFDSLEDNQKEIYLDIACYFSGWDETRPSYMWYDLGFHPKVEIGVLISKSLITIDRDNKFVMHDRLKELGIHIVREERKLGKQSRFMNKEEDVRHALLTNQGTRFVTALEFESMNEQPILASHFGDVPNIIFLCMTNQSLHGDFTRPMSKLRWLRWKISGKFMPTNMHMENLVILDLSKSQLKGDGDIWSHIKVGKKLKVLDLTYSSNLSVPSHISTFASLEILKISWCDSVRRLDGIEQLKMLTCIDACYCINLESLPNLSSLEKLVRLDLTSCTKLGEIQGLEKLVLLQSLDAGYCKKLVKIEGLHKLKSLEHLVLNKCYYFEANYLDVSELKKLKQLDVDYLKLTEIKGLHTLNSLEDLNLKDCKSLEGNLDFSELKVLKRIIACGCRKLSGIKGLHLLMFLEHLGLSDCSFKGVLDLSNLKNLKVLLAPKLEVTNIANSNKISELHLLCNDDVLDHLECLDILESLAIDGSGVCIESLTKFMDLPCLKRIKSLQIDGFLCIEELPSLSNLRKLRLFYVSNCQKLMQFKAWNGWSASKP